MVVILLIGIITAIGIPRFFRSPVSPVERFVGQLNQLVSQAVRTAHQKGKVQRVFFSLTNRFVQIQSLTKEVSKEIAIPKSVSISDVIIDGKSQFQFGEGHTVYFLINPDGLSQEVSLILIDTVVQQRQPDTGQYTFYLNPFTSVFRLT